MYILVYVYIIYINRYSHIQLHPQAGFGRSSESSQNFKPAAFLTPRVWDPFGLHFAELVQKKASMGSKDVEAVFQACPHPHPPDACVHQAGISDMSELPDVDNSHMGVDEATIKPWTVKNPSFPTRVR